MKFQKKRAALRIGMLSIMALYPAMLFANCDAILVHGIHNIQTRYSVEGAIATKYFNHCHKDFSSLNEGDMAKAEIEIFGISLGGGYSRSAREQRLTEWCVTNQETAVTNSLLWEQSQTIHSEAVRAWERCNELMSQNVLIDPNISDDRRTVNFSLRYTGAASSGVQFYGARAEGFSCKVTLPHGAPFDRTTPPDIGRQAISVQCKRRAPAEQIIDGTTYQILPRGAITLETASHSVLLSFPEDSNPALPQEKAALLEQEIQRLNDKTSACQEDIKTLSGQIRGMQVVVENDLNNCQQKSAYLWKTSPPALSCENGYALSKLQVSNTNADVYVDDLIIWCCKVTTKLVFH